MRIRTYFASAVIALTLAALLAPQGATADTAPCPDGTSLFAEYRLFFGRNKGDTEVVGDAAWRAFLAEEITPRFPDGLTVMDAAGQWRDAAGRLIRERSKLVVILAAPGPEGTRRIDAIVEAYKRDFDQDSVLRVVGTACAAF